MQAKTALLLIDFQCDYFQNGLFPLEGMESAAKKGAQLLAAFRDRGLPIVHVRHENSGNEAPFFRPGSSGAAIHTKLSPLASEVVVVKQHANAFLETDLRKILDAAGIKRLLIAGAMSNMCVDAATRAAFDFGYGCAVAHDACAAMNLAFDNISVPARQVHVSFMAALSLGYANVVSAEEFLRDLSV